MTIIAAGCNHTTTPLSVLERTTLDADRLPKVLHMLSQSEHISEVVVLSTCNRTEVYALVERFHGAAADIRDALAEVSLLAPEDIADYLDILHDEAAASHLFSVAAGLDSAVVGEAEILGQVRTAWESARAEGVIGPSLELLFRHAIECGKAARTQTDISRGTVSVSSAAVQLATARLDTLADKAVLLLGAGEMAEGMAHALAQAGVARMAVINRTWERAVALAQAVEQNGVEGQAVPVDTLADQLERVDLVLSGTGAAGTLVDTDE
ncbi:MAG: glutamyl-tRNA reductase, partial [Acidimicrobiales bacterium]